jgi:hypothetical protein
MAEEGAVETLPVAAVDEQVQAVVIGSARWKEQVVSIAFAVAIGDVKLASGGCPIGLRLLLPAGDDGRMTRDAGAIVVLGLVVKFRGIVHRSGRLPCCAYRAPAYRCSTRL